MMRKKRRKTPRPCGATIYVIQYTCAFQNKFQNVRNRQKETEMRMQRDRDAEKEREREKGREK